MTLPKYALEVMWDGVLWTSETSNLISVGWRRGRDYASQLTGRGTAGTLDAVLKNTAGRFASKNASGPLYGNLIPGRKVRLRTDNFIGNSSFESATDMDKWSAYGAGPPAITAVVDATAPHSAKAARITSSVVDAEGGITQTYSSGGWDRRPTGTVVTLSAYAKSPIGTVRLYFRDDTNNDTFAFADVTVPVNTWTRVSSTQTVPASRNLERVYVVPIEGAHGAGVIGYVDAVQLQDNSAATVYAPDGTLWQGYLDYVQPDPGSRQTGPVARLHANGPLAWIADKKASTAVFTSILTGTAVGKILDDAGWDATLRTIDAGLVTMNRWKADGDFALSHLRELEETEFSFLSESKDGKIVYEDAHHRLLTPHTASVATFSDAAAAAAPYDSIEQLDLWRDIFNRFTADVLLYTVQSIAVLWSLTGEVPTLNPGATLDFWAKYPTPDSPPQADSVDAWTTPVATTDYLANAASDGSGANLTASVSVVATKFANTMKISLTNIGTAAAFLTFLQARGTAVYANDPVLIVTEDSSSQTAYGKRSFPLGGKFYPSTTSARSFTQYGVSRYKDLQTGIRLGYQANDSDAHMAQALARDISDRITVVANGTLASQAQLGVSQDFYIEAETHYMDLRGHWVTYELSDANLDGGYWTLGVSTLGQSTKLNV